MKHSILLWTIFAVAMAPMALAISCPEVTTLPIGPVAEPSGEPFRIGPVAEPSGEPLRIGPVAEPSGEPLRIGPVAEPSGGPTKNYCGV